MSCNGKRSQHFGVCSINLCHVETCEGWVVDLWEININLVGDGKTVLEAFEHCRQLWLPMPVMLFRQCASVNYWLVIIRSTKPIPMPAEDTPFSKAYSQWGNHISHM